MGAGIMKYFADDIIIKKDNHRVMTREELQIPGVHMMGFRRFKEIDDRLDDHFHRTMEIVVVLKGMQRYVVGGETYVLQPYDALVTYPYECHGNGERLQTAGEIIWFQIDLSDSRNFLGVLPPYSEELYCSFTKGCWRKMQIIQDDICLLKSAFERLAAGGTVGHILGQSIFLQFLVKNFCQAELDRNKGRYSKDMESVMQYIQMHLNGDLSLEKLAGLCGLSVSRLKGKFKEQTGLTPHAYIIALKIERAKIYLKNTDIGITEVAYQLNFSSGSHFSMLFKKYVGCTPREYRGEELLCRRGAV